MNQSPDATFSSSASYVCGQEDVFFTSSSSIEQGLYLWDFGDGNFSTSEQFSGNQFASGECYDVSLSLTSMQGCTSNHTIENCVCAYAIPTASLSVDQYVSDAWELERAFENLSLGATAYVWHFGDDSISYAENPVHLYPGPGVYEVELMAINGDCFDVATARIEIKPELRLHVPTAFTPDDEDGVNDFWKPVFSDVNLLSSYKLEVFSRWGKRVFSSTDPDEFWRGNDGEGEYFVQTEMYTWVLQLSVPPETAFTCPISNGRKKGDHGAHSNGPSNNGNESCTVFGRVVVIR